MEERMALKESWSNPKTLITQSSNSKTTVYSQLAKHRFSQFNHSHQRNAEKLK